MKISLQTMKALASIIRFGTVGGNSTIWKSSRELKRFFSELGCDSIYLSSGQDNEMPIIAQLKKSNGTDMIVKMIEKALDPQYFGERTSNTLAAKRLNPYLKKDGYRLIPVEEESFNDEGILGSGGDFFFFEVRSISNETVEVSSIAKLDNSFINEQIDKAKRKLAEEDYDGAMTNAHSLVEAFLKEMISRSGVEVSEYVGNLPKLYDIAQQAINLDPSQEDLSETLSHVLSGLDSIIFGISRSSNEMGDRHLPKYRADHHHARLVVNAAFTFCEFLLESYEYQQSCKV